MTLTASIIPKNVFRVQCTTNVILSAFGREESTPTIAYRKAI